MDTEITETRGAAFGRNPKNSNHELHENFNYSKSWLVCGIRGYSCSKKPAAPNFAKKTHCCRFVVQSSPRVFDELIFLNTSLFFKF